MRTHLLFTSLLLLTPAAASAQQERLYTVAIVDDGSHPPGGIPVVDAQGQRRVLMGRLAIEIAENEGVVTVGAVKVGALLRASWVRAYASEQIKVRIGGQETTIPNGAALEVIGKEELPVPPQEPEYYEVRYHVRLADGRKVWLSNEEFDITFEPRSSALEHALVSGLVEKDAQGRVFIVAREQGRLQVSGALKELVGAAVGRFVEGFGLVFKNANPPLLQLTSLEGTTTRETHVFRRPDATSGKSKLDRFEDVDLTGSSTGGFHRVRYNWPLAPAPSGVAQSYVLAADVEIGHAWADLTGKVVKKVDGNETRYAIVTPTGEVLIEYGSSAGVLDDDLFAPLVDRVVRVDGDIDTVGYGRGDISVRSIHGTLTRALPAANGLPALAAGTRLKVIGFDPDYSGSAPRYSWKVELASGQTAELGFAASTAVRLGEPTTGGIVSGVPGN